MNLKWYIWLILPFFLACVRKPDEISGPTIGKQKIGVDYSLKEIIQQQENIFERNYKYADVQLQFASEHDVITMLLHDSVQSIITNRPLHEDELSYWKTRQINPRQVPLATSAIAFITSNENKDTTILYEDLIRKMSGHDGDVTFVVEDPKSGISNVLLKTLQTENLPGHFYAYSNKQDVLKYLLDNPQAIGIIDYTEISDSDEAFTKEVLARFHLLHISRPKDSVQVGYLAPFQYNLQDRHYPFTQDLYFISITGKSDVGIGFASFITGEIGQKIMLKAGLLPLYQTERTIELKGIQDIVVEK